MKFRINDYVRFLNEVGEGYITKIIDKKFVLIDIVDGIEIRAAADELILIHRMEVTTETPKVAEKVDDLLDEKPVESPKKTNQIPVLKKEVIEPDAFSISFSRTETIDVNQFAHSLSIQVVDLHIEKITKNYSGLSNSEKMHLQLKEFEKYMNEGYLGKHQRLIFIHGVGAGVLRRELHARLKEYSGIKYMDADERAFGYGATEVIFT